MMSIPTQIALQDTNFKPEIGSLTQELEMMVKPQSLTHKVAILRLRQAI